MNCESTGLPDSSLNTSPHADAPADGYVAPIAALRRIELDTTPARQAGLPAGLWTLTRIAPRGERHAQVRYRHSSGREVVGQWFADPPAYAKALNATRILATLPARVVALPQYRVFWQLGGADRRLPNLAPLCGIGATLIVHHPEQRAVVQLATAPHYVKVMRPQAAAALAETLRTVHIALADSGVHTPDVLFADPAAGLVMTRALPGRSILAWLGDETCTPSRLAAMGRLAGAAIARLHASGVPCHAERDAAAVAAGLDRGLQRLGWVAPGVRAYLEPYLLTIRAALIDTPHTASVPIHRDCYDKQFVGDDSGMGLLDFDTLSWGEAALDVANFLVHCDLRAWQGRCSRERAAALAAGFVQGYGAQTLPRDRLQAYADATRLRLASVYGCRPPQRGVVTRLVESIGAPLIGLDESAR